VTRDTFLYLIQYLYTDDVPDIAPEHSVDLLELANRLCLPRLVHLTEQNVIQQLSSCHVDQALDYCLTLLEPCQVGRPNGLVFCIATTNN